MIAPGDWSGDGYPDVLAVRGDGQMFLFRGNGAGSWITGMAEQVGTNWSFSQVAAAGDFSGDGKPDLIAIDATGRLLLYRGNDSGGWITGSGELIGSGFGPFTLVPAPALAWAPDGLLVREKNDATVYFFSDGIRYAFTSPKAASAFGADLSQTRVWPVGALASIPRGANITTNVSAASTGSSITADPEQAATSADWAEDPAGATASAAGSSKCRWISNSYGFRVGPVDAGSVTLRGRFCRNPTAHTTWVRNDTVSVSDHVKLGAQIAGYSIEQVSRLNYNVTHGSWSKGGMHLEAIWKVKHCTPPIGPAICTRTPEWHNVTSGYYDGSYLNVNTYDG